MRQRLRQRIHVRQQLPIWGLRLVLGAIMLTFSELIMWQNPPARAGRVLDWPLLLVLYTALAAIMMDAVVRFQVRSLPTLLLVGGLYGLVSATIVARNAFDNMPYTLLVRGLGLQTGAGFYGLLLFISVMRGKQVTLVEMAGAAAIGVLWGVWVHWYPIRPNVGWGLVPIETATIYVLPALAVAGVMVLGVAPRFQVLREKRFELLWWEAIVVGLPLFAVLIYGMAQDSIPFFPLLLVIAIGAFMVWALHYQRVQYEPSIFAEMIFSAPNPVTYIALAVAFLVAGSLAYNLVTDADSIVGIASYWLVFAFGAAWLPGVSLFVFWQAYRRQTAPVPVGDDEPDEAPPA